MANPWYVLGINLLFLGAGVLSAYFAHEEDRDLERVCNELRHTRKQLDRVWHRWIKVAAAHDRLRAEALRSAETIKDHTFAKLSEYRDNVCRFRAADAPLPKHFDYLPRDGVFRPRDMESEFDRPPPSINEILKRVRADAERGRQGVLRVRQSPRAY